VETLETEGAIRFSMKTQDADHMRREAEAAHGVSMRHLLSKCGTPVRLLCRSHRCVDEVFDTGSRASVARRLPCNLFPGDARLQGVLHAEDAPHAANAGAQRRLVIRSPLTTSTPLAPSAAAFPLSGLALGRADETRYPAALARPRLP